MLTPTPLLAKFKECNDLFFFNAFAIFSAPAGPMSLEDKSIICNDLFTSSAAAIFIAPSSPISHSHKSRVRIVDVFLFNTSPIPLAPSELIILNLKLRCTLLALSKGQTFNISVIFLPSKSNFRNDKVRFSRESQGRWVLKCCWYFTFLNGMQPPKSKFSTLARLSSNAFKNFSHIFSCPLLSFNSSVKRKAAAAKRPFSTACNFSTSSPICCRIFVLSSSIDASAFSILILSASCKSSIGKLFSRACFNSPSSSIGARPSVSPTLFMTGSLKNAS
mmetsp:Transcript_27471/g.33587  ORF Transcript_27471/g.33587 Transcript_27471/m.33587 type:complete len:276 (-) Transcript_27471:888-1715(-)